MKQKKKVKHAFPNRWGRDVDVQLSNLLGWSVESDEFKQAMKIVGAVIDPYHELWEWHDDKPKKIKKTLNKLINLATDLKSTLSESLHWKTYQNLKRLGFDPDNVFDANLCLLIDALEAHANEIAKNKLRQGKTTKARDLIISGLFDLYYDYYNENTIEGDIPDLMARFAKQILHCGYIKTPAIGTITRGEAYRGHLGRMAKDRFKELENGAPIDLPEI
jgi:hypothetical protein